MSSLNTHFKDGPVGGTQETCGMNSCTMSDPWQHPFHLDQDIPGGLGLKELDTSAERRAAKWKSGLLLVETSNQQCQL